MHPHRLPLDDNPYALISHGPNLETASNASRPSRVKRYQDSDSEVSSFSSSQHYHGKCYPDYTYYRYIHMLVRFVCRERVKHLLSLIFQCVNVYLCSILQMVATMSLGFTQDLTPTSLSQSRPDTGRPAVHLVQADIPTRVGTTEVNQALQFSVATNRCV